MTAFLVEHGLELALGITIVLGVGALATACTHDPIQRHALARLSLVAAWGAALLLALPLPRPARFDLGRPVLVRSEEPVRAVTQLPVNAGLDPFFMGPADWSTGVAPVAEASPHPLRPTLVPTFAAPAPPLDLGPWLARIFLIGAAAFALHLFVCMAVLRRTLRRARPAPTRVADAIDGWSRQAHVRARVLMSERTTRPFCCGVLQGTIVLPAELATPARRDGLEAVARHELAHLAQHHPAARVLAALSAPLLYWNPLYWWLARELRRSAEILADDAAAASLDKRRYVSELLSLAERSSPPVPAPGIGVLGSRREFLQRMETLLMRHDRLPTSTSRLHLAGRSIGALLLLCTVSVAWGHAPQESSIDPVEVTLTPPPEEFPEIDPVQLPTPVGLVNVNEAAIDALEAASAPQDRLTSYGLEYLKNTQGSGSYGGGDSRSDRAAPTTKSSWLDCVLEVDDPSALGLFLYAAGDSKLQLGGFALSSGDEGSRTARFVIARSALPELALVARAVAGARVLSCQVRPGPRADATNGIFGGRVSAELDRTRRHIDLKFGSAPAADPVTAPVMTGHVTQTAEADGTTLLTIDLGSDDGVREGTTFEIYSESRYKGRVRVVAVAEQTCTATVVLKVRSGWIRVGDSAASDL